MSGPIRPPLRVRDTDSNPNVIPVNTIVVSDGDLVDDGGATVTIDTTGSSTEPGAPALSIQYNSDPAGTFTGDAGFKMLTEGGGSTTAIAIGDVAYGGAVYAVKANSQDGSLLISPEGTGQLTLTPNDDSGGTKTDMQVNINGATATGEAFVRFSNLSAPTATVGIDGTNGHLILEADTADKDIQMKLNGTGVALVQNQTTNNDTTLTVKGNGTGDSNIQLTNDSNSIELICDTNQKLKVKGGVNSFVFDASSGTGGITWPDGTTQTTAASGGSSFLPPPVGSGLTDACYIIASMFPTGTTSTITLLNGYAIAIPFVAPSGGLSLTTSGTSGQAQVKVSTAQASSTVLVGIYDATTNGALPDSLLATATIDVSATGRKRANFDSAVSLTEGTVYWAAYLRPSGETGSITLESIEEEGLNIFLQSGDNNNQVYHTTSSLTSFPSTFTPEDRNANFPLMGVVY